jgi:CRISPR-associated protein Cst2
VAGYDTYGFDEQGRFGPLARISSDDLPGGEFWVGGEVVRAMSADERARLQAAGVHLHDNPQRLLAALAEAAYQKG